MDEGDIDSESEGDMEVRGVAEAHMEPVALPVETTDGIVVGVYSPLKVAVEHTLLPLDAVKDTVADAQPLTLEDGDTEMDADALGDEETVTEVVADEQELTLTLTEEVALAVPVVVPVGEMECWVCVYTGDVVPDDVNVVVAVSLALGARDELGEGDDDPDEQGDALPLDEGERDGVADVHPDALVSAEAVGLSVSESLDETLALLVDEGVREREALIDTDGVAVVLPHGDEDTEEKRVAVTEEMAESDF